MLVLASPGWATELKLPGFLPGKLTNPPAQKQRVKLKKKKKKKKKKRRAASVGRAMTVCDRAPARKNQIPFLVPEITEKASL